MNWSTVEFSVLSAGAFELSQQLDVPYKVVINEAVELAQDLWRYGRPQVRQRRTGQAGTQGQGSGIREQMQSSC